jgi:uncharacterized protein
MQQTTGPAAAAQRVLGRVIAPPGKEATLESFYFWARPEDWVEKPQHILVESDYGEGRVVRFFGVVDDAAYVEMSESVHVDRMRRDEMPTRELEGGMEEGTAYYKASILASDPEVLIPPRGGSVVRAASREEVAFAYGFDRIRIPIPLGLLRNGARTTIGPAMIDAAYLLGENGAHMNTNGISGVATKTSTLLAAVMSVLQTAQGLRRQNSPDQFLPVPVLFSVKGTDMLWLDKPSRVFADRPELAGQWTDMGLEPRPFRNARFMVPAMKGHPSHAQDIVNRSDLIGYSWGLADIIEHGLLGYLFSAEDRTDQNFSFLLGLWEQRLTEVRDGRRRLAKRERGLKYSDNGTPQTFHELIELMSLELESRDTRDNDGSSRMENAHIGTMRKFFRRLRKVQQESMGVIAWDSSRGNPPKLIVSPDVELQVIDVASLAASPDMQRFVISAVIQQMVEERSHPQAPAGIRYLVMLDELNMWAPRGSTDATTRLFERIATLMRSLGIVLLGAQQFASQVSEKIPENSSIRVVGRTGSGELANVLYNFLSAADKQMVTRLKPGEMLMMMPTFRAPAHIRVPFPAFAMRLEEAMLGEDGPQARNAGPEDEGEMFDFRGDPSDIGF